jgi:hypothetical protein
MGTRAVATWLGCRVHWSRTVVILRASSYILVRQLDRYDKWGNYVYCEKTCLAVSYIYINFGDVKMT